MKVVKNTVFTAQVVLTIDVIICARTIEEVHDKVLLLPQVKNLFELGAVTIPAIDEINPDINGD